MGARRLLYLECALVYGATGLFLVLPLHLAQRGYGERFFAGVYAAGAVGALACTAGSAALIARFGLARLAPWGGGLFAAGSLLYWVAAESTLGPAWYVCASLVQGLGWGIAFTLGPVCLSARAAQATRARWFAVYGACGSIGVGIAPVAARWLLDTGGMSHADIFLGGALAGLLAGCASFAAARHGYGGQDDRASDAAAEDAGGVDASASGAVASGAAASGADGRLADAHWRTLLALPGAGFFALVALGACIYTGTMNFQTLYAAAHGLDYGVFYGCYGVAAVLARFLFSAVPQSEPARLLPRLLWATVAALVMLALAPYSAPLYALGAALLGAGAGLAYPIVQAQAADRAPPKLRARVLAAFSLCYLVPRYAFPYCAALLVGLGGYGLLAGALVLLGLAQLPTARYAFARASK